METNRSKQTATSGDQNPAHSPLMEKVADDSGVRNVTPESANSNVARKADEDLAKCVCAAEADVAERVRATEVYRENLLGTPRSDELPERLSQARETESATAAAGAAEEGPKKLPATSVKPEVSSDKDSGAARPDATGTTEVAAAKAAGAPAGPGPAGGQVATSEVAVQVATPPTSTTVELAPAGESLPPPPPPPPPMPEWKVLEPEDHADPVDHEICHFEKLNDQWSILAASLRGKLHAHKALWRDDAYQFGRAGAWTILAVSDGAGSAKFSRIGARIACDESVNLLEDLLAGYTVPDMPSTKVPPRGSLKQLQAFLVLAACAARDGIMREAQNRKVAETDLYATLLLVIHGRWREWDLIGGIQVGDGAVGVYTKDDRCTLVGSADHGEYSSETVFLTSWKGLIERPYDHRVKFTVKRDVRCIAAMCDGVSDDFFPEDKRLIELFVGNPIRELKTKSGEPVRGVLLEVVKEPREGRALLDWLRYEKKGSSDDRTLVLLYGT